jgi:hypothetical protein
MVMQQPRAAIPDFGSPGAAIGLAGGLTAGTARRSSGMTVIPMDYRAGWNVAAKTWK